MKSLNKNISVWRGSDTPPTKYHIWVKNDNSILIFINDSWKEIISSKDKKKLNRLIDNSTDEDSPANLYLPSKSGTLALDDVVTSYSNGLMSSGDKVRLDSLIKMSAEDVELTDYDNVFTDLDIINSLCNQINDCKEGESTTETVLNLIEQINN